MDSEVTRRSVLRGAGVVAAGAAAATVAPGAAFAHSPHHGGPVPTAPASVRRFLASLGACTHIGQGVDDAAGVAGVLPYLGVSNVRDDSSVAATPNWLTLHDLCGAKVDLIAQSDSVDNTIEIAERLARHGALLSVEGPNEPNNQPVTYNGQTSDHTTDFTPVAYYCRDLYRRVKSDPMLRHVPVFASSEAGGSEPNNVGLQFLRIPRHADTLLPAGTRFADYANTHTYPDRAPGWVDNLAWNVADPTLNGAWDGLYVEFGHTWYGGFPGYPTPLLPRLPRVMTETGWATQGSGSITEDQQGRLILCLYLANFTRGWRNTFIYMLRDDPVQGFWGLVDTDYNPKPSGTYLHNLTSILADDRHARIRRPEPLRYRIANQPPAVHDVLLQKSNGARYLVVWNEQADGAESVSVTLGGPPRQVRVYDPTAGARPVEVLRHGRSIELSLANYDCRVLAV